MKAMILKDFGGVENLVKADIPVPPIGDDEVLVKVMALSINPVDIKTRVGKALAQQLKDDDPVILGWDISGVVSKTGKTVTSFMEGDEVFGMINFPGHGRAYAEYVAAPESHLALKPANISHEEAAAASLAALTAWQILDHTASVRKGNRVLIHAAAGGVGHYAVQMAKYLGAHVTGTASGGNVEFLKGLGADLVIDYKKEKFEDAVNNIDFVLDGVGGNYIDRSLKTMKQNGLIISIPSGAAEAVTEKAKAEGLNGQRFMVRSNGKHMREIASLLETGKVVSYISKVYRFDGIPEAHLQIETGKTRGKVVVTV